MKDRPGFIRTTLVGGILYLVPIVLLVFVIGKAAQLMSGISPPFVRAIDRVGLGDILTPQVVAILLVVLFCFGAGLFARTVVAKRIVTFLETNLLANLPGYSFYKSVGASLAGDETQVGTLAFARIEDAWQIALVVDTLENGLLSVFVPDVPQGRSGSLYFMAPDRIRPLDIPIKDAMSTLRRMGMGSREILKGVPHLDPPA